MKLAIISAVYPPYKGGQAVVAAMQARELVMRGHEVTVITHTPTKQLIETNIDGVSVKYIPTLFNIGITGFVPNISKYLIGFDHILVHYPSFGLVENIARISKRINTPYSIWYHFDPHGIGVKELLFKVYEVLFSKSILQHARAIYTSSLDYIEHSSIAHLKHKCIEIPFGVGEVFFNNTTLIQPYSTQHLLFVAALDEAHYFKGLELLLRTFADLKTSVPLVICGDGSMRSYYESLVRVLNLESSVRFEGRVSDDRLAGLYRGACATVLPSIDGTEAFGLVLAESMASHTPVIASDLPGVRSVARDQETGLLFPAGSSLGLRSALQAILSNSDLRTRLSQGASNYAQNNLQWPLHVQKLERTLL